MTLNRVKLGCTVTFMNYLASAASLIFPPGTLICNKNHALAVKFTKDSAIRTHNN